MAIVSSASQLSTGSLTSTAMLADLVRRCTHENELRGTFATIAAYCGFDAFSFLLLADAPAAPTVIAHWTSACPRWRARYAQRQHQVADPRVVLTAGRCVPILWHSPASDASRLRSAFLADAARFGLRGGVAHSFDDARVGRIVLSWDLSDEVHADRVVRIEREIAALALLAGFVREAMLGHCQAALATRTCARLTPRERQCVSYAARGMTSSDIGGKLGITERTVNFHFGNITHKLGVLNRAEAIVRAIALRAVPPV